MAAQLLRSKLFSSQIDGNTFVRKLNIGQKIIVDLRKTDALTKNFLVVSSAHYLTYQSVIVNYDVSVQ